MLVTKKSQLSGDVNTLDLNVTREQLDTYAAGGRNVFVQKVFPDLSPNEREFIKTGVTPAEWQEMFDEKPNSS